MTGEMAGHYKTLNKLGCGGRGKVYKAGDTILRRTAALKFLTQAISYYKSVRKKITHEAQTGSMLDYHNICAIYETGPIGGALNIILQICEDPDEALRTIL